MVRTGMVNGIIIFLVDVGIISICVLVARINPVDAKPLRSVRLNIAYTLVSDITHAITVPVISIATVATINTAGGGCLVLPSSGWMLFPAFLLYAFSMDFFEYLFHRAQHRVPLMWSMHSLHHSDPTMNASTTARHYWAEYGIKMMTIYMVAGIIFKANASILEMYALLGFYNVFPHMNLRVGFGRWWMVMNSPQYHRIHHSSLRAHWDCNFSALFPIFDLIFSTYHKPKKDEYPPTGLDTGEQPSGLIEAIFWPVRNLRRGAKAMD